MTLQKTSEEFRALFLLEFTRELIKNSRQGAIFELKNILKERNEEIKSQVSRIIKRKNLSTKKSEELIPSLLTKKNLFEPLQEEKQKIEIPKQNFITLAPRKRFAIPHHELPPQFQNLKPTPTNKEIDLEKLNPLIQDMNVIAIESHEANSPIMVRIPQLKKTGIVLNQDEMNNTAKKFSDTTKIPLHDGVFRVAFGKLMFVATISNNNCINFSISRIRLERQNYSQ